MSRAVVGLLDQLRVRRQELATRAMRQLEHAQRCGREELLPAEREMLSGIAALDERIRDQQDEFERMGDLSALSARFGSTTRKQPPMNDFLTYRQHDHQTSWLRDLVKLQIGRDDTGECRDRLMRHAQDVASQPEYTEYRDLSRTEGSGGYAVPPAWLMDLYVELARPGRAFANLVQNMPLPGGTDSINIPKLLSGTRQRYRPPTTRRWSSRI